jgi:hypothetical protein
MRRSASLSMNACVLDMGSFPPVPCLPIFLSPLRVIGAAVVAAAGCQQSFAIGRHGMQTGASMDRMQSSRRPSRPAIDPLPDSSSDLPMPDARYLPEHH